MKLAEQFATEQYEIFHQNCLAEPKKDDFDRFQENNNY